MDGRRAILFSAFAVGFTALSSQIVFLRELLVLFYGNELSLGVVMGSWLFWTGAGSLVLGRCSDRLREPARGLAFFQVLLAFALIVTLLAVRAAKLPLDASPGQILGYVPMFLIAFVVLAPFCLLNGFLFSLGCRAYGRATRSSRPGEEARSVGLVYIYEAAGSVAGGLIVSLWLIRVLSPWRLFGLLAALNLAASWILTANLPPRGWRSGGGIARGGLLIVWLALLVSGRLGAWEKRSLEWQWRGFALKKTENSIYGNLAVTGRDGQISLFENGLLMFTRPDELAAEQSVHFALLEHPAPRRVLLIGGGVGGALEEILKYPSLETVTYVELDPAIISLTREYLPPGEGRFLDDPRVEIVQRDGRLYLEEEGERFDVIIVNLPDPFTAQINRFYTEEFFRLVQSRLAPGGVLSLGATSAENYIGPELQDFLGCIYSTLKTVFPSIAVIPGDRNYFIASDRSGYLTNDALVLEQRIRKRGLDLRYVRSYYLADRLRQDRLDFIMGKLLTAARVQVNRDFHPICYYYDLVFWSTYFSGEAGGWFSRFLLRAAVIRWWWFALPVVVALVLSPWLRSRRAKSKGAWILWPVATSGFAEITFQVVVLLAFQILYGFVYYKLGILFSLFMVGLVIGGWAVTRSLPRLRAPRRTLVITQAVICIYPLILPAVFKFLPGPPGSTLAWAGDKVIFPLLPFVAGFVGGFQFPLACSIYLERRKRLGLVSGLTYGCDLLGACLGALLVSALIVPVLGVVATCWAVVLLGLSSLLAAIVYS